MADAPNQPASGHKAGQPPKDVMGMLEYYLKDKAPYQIPENGRKAIVEWGPWIELVLLLLSAPILLLAMGLSFFVLPMAGAAAPGIGIAWVILLVQVILQVAALPGLFAKKKQGWTLAFYAVVASFVSSLLYGNILGALVGFVVGMYVLFQIKSYYA